MWIIIHLYLLSVDDTRYFLAEKKGELLKGQYIGEMADAGIHKEYAAVVEGLTLWELILSENPKPKATALQR